jgi:hypothetical protein
MARQAGEEGRLVPLRGSFGSFWKRPLGTQATVAGWIPADPAEFSASRKGMLAFVFRHVYPPPLVVVVRSSCVG